MGETSRSGSWSAFAVGRNRALVAVQPSTGDVLAVANRPVDDTYNRAFEGSYPPGSAFKVVTTAALLRTRGLTPDTPIDCPRTRIVGGRLFRDFEGRAGGIGPFSRSFAESCNTAFVGLSRQLEAGELTLTARTFGLGREIDAGLPAFGGRVRPSEDPAAWPPRPSDKTASSPARSPLPGSWRRSPMGAGVPLVSCPGDSRGWDVRFPTRSCEI